MGEKKIADGWEDTKVGNGWSPPDEITVSYPIQKLSPLPFNNFEVGGLYFKTYVKNGESKEEAFDRAFEFISTQAEKQWRRLYDDFKTRYKAVRDFDKELRDEGLSDLVFGEEEADEF